MAVPPSPLLGGFWPSDDEHFRQHQRWQPESKVTNWTSARKDAVTMPPTRTLARYLNFSYTEGVIRLKFLSNNSNKSCNVKFQLQCQQWAIRSSALFHIRALWRVREWLFENPIFEFRCVFSWYLKSTQMIFLQNNISNSTFLAMLSHFWNSILRKCVAASPRPRVHTSPSPRVPESPSPHVPESPRPHVSTSPSPHVPTSRVPTTPRPHVPESPRPRPTFSHSPAEWLEWTNRQALKLYYS